MTYTILLTVLEAEAMAKLRWILNSNQHIKLVGTVLTVRDTEVQQASSLLGRGGLLWKTLPPRQQAAVARARKKLIDSLKKE